MSNDYKSPAFKKLLDSLQQQSWELELIISGFAIFGLFTAYEPLEIKLYNAENNDQIYQFVVYVVALAACSILLFNLLLHVVLRGLWIGALGLRYISGDIDFEALKYSPKFRNYLEKRIVSFDRYIASLENYCSILFAVSFLLIFYVLALTMVIISMVLLGTLIVDNEQLPHWISKYIGAVLAIFLLLGMVLTFIDFATQGYLLKRKQWISKIYFPIYWVFSFITLSFLYRPLVYNFLDNKFGKRLVLALVPIYVAILFLTSIEYRNSNYLEKDKNSNSRFANKENYMDMLTSEADFPGDLVIPSKIITTNYLQVFMPFREELDDRIFAFDETLKPENDRRGLSSDIQFSSNWDDKIKSIKQKDSIRKKYVETFNTMYLFQIDSTTKDGEFILTTNKKDVFGFETVLKLDSLSEGKHLLKLRKLRKKKEKIDTLSTMVIPFWYFKN
ncbi:hypothetical protein GCM10011414_29200 [Croceivirga lutea]|uniref:hypothetical protein n=1 Tax=Croceivirga lutea TaxID=1775167 RepID=UPI00163ACF9F|nr:hypothetical protein [Croceivirga lutea]GGG57534.1 hypothetical protein GCM10011414_29200 [Croceivirga lutea]